MRRVPSTLVSYIVCHFCSSALSDGVEPEGPAGVVDQQSARTEFAAKRVHGRQVRHIERQRTRSPSEL